MIFLKTHLSEHAGVVSGGKNENGNEGEDEGDICQITRVL